MRAIATVVLLVSCCGKGSSADAVNALVDKGKNPKLHFVTRDVTLNKGQSHELTLAVVVPEGWTLRDRTFYADLDDRGGNNMAFSSSCAGEPCRLGDFKPDIEKNLTDVAKAFNARVVTNRSMPNERVWATEAENHDISVDRFWWFGDSPPEYFGCWVVASGEFEPSRAAFEKACEGATIRN